MNLFNCLFIFLPSSQYSFNFSSLCKNRDIFDHIYYRCPKFIAALFYIIFLLKHMKTNELILYTSFIFYIFIQWGFTYKFRERNKI